MRFVDQHGRTILDVLDDTEVVDFPRLEGDIKCVNLVDGLRSLPRLKVFLYSLSRREGQDEIEILCGLSQLRELAIAPLPHGLDVTPLTTCTGLTSLRLVAMVNVDLAPLASLANLEELLLDGSTKNLAAIGALKRLKSLSVMFNKRVSLKWFSSLSNIEKLFFVGSRLSDFDVFQKFPRLMDLNLGNTNIQSLSCLANNTEIKKLNLGRCRKLETLDGIERLTSLAWLELEDTKSIPSIRPLAGLRHLKALYMRDTQIADGDLSPLMQLPELADVVLMPEYVDQSAEVARRLPHCQISFVGRHKGGKPSEIHGAVEIFRDVAPKAESVAYRIDQDLTELLNVETNDEADELVQEEMERRFPEAMKDLEFDTEGAAFVVYSPSLDAIRLVARCINDLEGAPRATPPEGGAS
jgi:hypothetical protein